MHHLRIVSMPEHFHSHVWRHQDCLVVRSDSVFPQRVCVAGLKRRDDTVSKLLFLAYTSIVASGIGVLAVLFGGRIVHSQTHVHSGSLV